MSCTIEDVAKLAGVSKSTVSRVLTGSPKVSPAARQAVERAIAETGFRLNAHARSLASGRSDAIAVLLTQPTEELFDDPTIRGLSRGVNEGLGDREEALLVLLAGSPREQRRAVRFLDKQRIDGVVHLTPHHADPILPVVMAAKLPMVVCGTLPGVNLGPQIRTVTITDREGAASAVRYLRECGAKRIAAITGPKDAPGSSERLMGYRDALDDAYDPALVVHGDYTLPSGRDAMRSLLDSSVEFDAVFCASDRMAAGVYQVAQERGLSIPGDLQVVGFDGHPLGEQLVPTLTTVAQPIEYIGRQTVEMLNEMITGGDPGHRVFPTELVVRGSTRNPD
ncbi:LacI family DNA-binding transcriptional regulator [Tessaracoccus flavus]|uniref:LacI family DNA-binding transcriptional regulator n=1 Tax=Tessaracoccus flavus TaxID=1610493 RepID=UPI00089D2B5E|nr:LacI family DNA-binding transcriptional regulator [Tessaracoccus flavus]SDY87921.1 transcriptional regulator, LacI family [Tessaracoccus flavus]